MTTPRYRAGKRLWEPHEDALLRAVFPNVRTSVVAEQLGRTTQAVSGRAVVLGVRKSQAYLESPDACRLRRGDGVGRRTQFAPGHVPVSKGLRRPGWFRGRMRETQFRKGERRGKAAVNYQPIGAERISKDGYRERKVNDNLPMQRRWRFVHVLLWEAAHGPVPPGHALSFVNGDRADIRLDNLRLVHRRDLLARNSVHTLPPELARTIQLLGALTRVLRNRESHAQKESH